MYSHPEKETGEKKKTKQKEKNQLNVETIAKFFYYGMALTGKKEVMLQYNFFTDLINDEVERVLLCYKTHAVRTARESTLQGSSKFRE